MTTEKTFSSVEFFAKVRIPCTNQRFRVSTFSIAGQADARMFGFLTFYRPLQRTWNRRETRNRSISKFLILYYISKTLQL